MRALAAPSIGLHVEPAGRDGYLEVRREGDGYRFEVWDWTGEVYATGSRATYVEALGEARRWA